MGCLFSKKAKSKSPEKEPTPTTVEEKTNSSSNANNIDLGSNTAEDPPKQYSWDKREKVWRRCMHGQGHLTSYMIVIVANRSNTFHVRDFLKCL